LTASDFKIVEEPKRPLAMHPRKFAMWLFIGSVLMLFAALTSAYIVRQAEGNWVFFELPSLFYSTTIVILLSSVTMQWAYVALKKQSHQQVVLMLALTVLLGTAFLVGQWVGWQQLVDQRVYFVGNPSGSFLYVLTGLHAVHIVSSLVFAAITWVRASRHKLALASLEMCATYWHFLGGLWLYLFVFLILNR